MALPIAHFSVAWGLAQSRDRLMLLALAIISVAPDFDFVFVWGLGMPIQAWHRTWSHSVLFALALVPIWVLLRPKRLQEISGLLFFSVLASHGFLDLFCTADAADHGVMVFWPLSTARYGWPGLVPLYLSFADSPFSLQGTLRFTFLELLLAPLLWSTARLLRRASSRVFRHPWLAGSLKAWQQSSFERDTR